MLHETRSKLSLPGALGIVEDIFSSLNARKIRWCHWKSNEHLYAALNGDTDLDLLFDESQYPDVVNILKSCGFIRFHAPWYRRYPHIEDYIGIDPETGKIVHAHSHFRLVLGESAVKSFRLPWEADLLSTRLSDDKTGFPVSEHTRELLLLFVRAAIKNAYPAPLRWVRGRGVSQGSIDDFREYEWLKQRVNVDELYDLAKNNIGTEAANVVAGLYETGPDETGLNKLFLASRKTLNKYRRYNHIVAYALRWCKWGATILSHIMRKRGWGYWPTRRTLPSSGLIVAVLGADGSGKSTLVKSLENRLSVKIDVLRLYLGSGDGPSSLLRRPAIYASRLYQKLKNPGQEKPGNITMSVSGLNNPGPNVSLPRTLFQVYSAIAIAIEKRARLRRANHARKSGFIVVTDRYPQAQFAGYNDGPRLGYLEDSKSALARWVARWEKKQYQSENIPAPDLVIKLIGDPAILNARRPELDTQTISYKQDSIASLSFPSGTTVVHIDPQNAADLVLAQSMKALSELLIKQTS